MSIKPIFSILIANFNNGNYFKDCWASVLAQTYTHWEVVIVDDASTDNSLEIIRQLVENDSRVKIFVNESNRGCGFTKRKCAELATGELCGFVDPDDTLEPNAIELMVKTYEENPIYGLIFSRFNIVDENLKFLSERSKVDEEDFNSVNFFNFGGVISHFAVFKREVYLQTEGIDAYMLRAVDQDLYLKLCEKTKVKHISNILYNYRIHQNGISTGGNESENVSKASYWHWYAINAAAKRRGVYVEDLFVQSFMNISHYKRLQSKLDLIENSGSYKLAQKIGKIKRLGKK